MNGIIELSPSMRMEMRLDQDRADEARLDVLRPEIRATPLPDDRADTPSDFAPCARCGRWSKLKPYRGRNGGIVWLQPFHFCLHGTVEGVV